jgi:outer membrane murein-binding lipoprotein Lpp
LASALASLEAERKAGVLAGSNANARISELESALEAKPDQPAIDVDALVERISQAAKRSES